MARLRAFGSKARGSVGAVTYYVANGQQIAREKSVEVKNPKSEAQAVQRMKLAPAQKFYDAFTNILDHSWQNAKYGTQSRQKFMSEAMKQNGGPYVVKGFSTMIPGTYLVSSGSLPEITCVYADNDFDSIDTSIQLTSNPEQTTRAGFVNKLLQDNPWFREGDKLTFMTIRKFDSGFSTKSFQLILRATLNAGETDDGEELSNAFSSNQDRLFIEIITTPFSSDNFTTAAMAIIHSRGNNQNDDARSTSRMCVSPEIYELYYSESAYRVAVRSYQEDVTNPLGAEWYLNNFPAGTIGRVVLKTISIGSGNNYNVLSLVIEEAGTNQTFVLVDSANRPLDQFGQNYPMQVDKGTPTLPWSTDYMKIFNGTTEFLDQDTAYSKIMEYLGVTSGTQLIAEAEQGTYTPKGGGQTTSAEILAVTTSAHNKYVILTCTYSDGYNAGGGYGSRITAAPVVPEEIESTLFSVLVPHVDKPASRWEINVGSAQVTRIEIDTTILGITLDWNL